MKTTVLIVSILLGSGGLIYAQGRYAAPGRISRVNLAQTQTITGVITAVDIGYGAQYPSITVNDIVIKVAPLWYLQEQDFELHVNDSVQVLAAPCSLAGDSYLYAITITNTETAAAITLRDSSGFPLWSGVGGGRPATRLRQAGRGPGVDPASVRTISGTVERISFGPGIQIPTLVVKTAEGPLVTVKIGPERVLLAADFELRVGESVTVTLATCIQGNIALQLTNSAAVTVVLRDADGTPNWN
jgi:hypothetical protein